MSHVTIAERAVMADDPYDYCIARFTWRALDRKLHKVTFHFADESSLTFNIRYEVTK